MQEIPCRLSHVTTPNTELVQDHLCSRETAQRLSWFEVQFGLNHNRHPHPEKSTTLAPPLWSCWNKSTWQKEQKLAALFSLPQHTPRPQPVCPAAPSCWVPSRCMPSRWMSSRWVPSRWVPSRWMSSCWVPCRWVPSRRGWPCSYNPWWLPDTVLSSPAPQQEHNHPATRLLTRGH